MIGTTRSRAADPVRRFAVVGSPIEHSLSPLLHAVAYRELGIEDAVYERHEVGAGELAGFLTGDGAGLQGLSVTMPGKPEAFALAAEHDGTAAALGVANTLVRRRDGSWRAENHDVHGIVAALRDHGAGTVRRAGVLGSGATALSAALALCRMGAQEILLSARRPERLAPVVDLVTAQGADARIVPWDGAAELLGTEVVVSALAAAGARAVAEEWRARPDLPVVPLLLDVLYDPWPAPLAGLLGERGTEVANGLEMLVHQADMQIRSMVGAPSAPVAAMLDAAREQLRR